MKTYKIISTILLTMFMLVLVSCENNDPLAPELNVAQNKVVKKAINILSIGGDSRSLSKVTTVSEWITIEEGGSLELRHQNVLLSNEWETLRIDAKLEILKNTISEDADVSLTIDDLQFVGNMDVTFAPHGTTFSEPALLNIKARGLELNGVDPYSLKLYYDNQETGEWEEMEYEEFKYDYENGRIEFKKAQLPHFSRYAVGYDG